MAGQQDRLEAAQALLVAIRQAGVEIWLTPDSKVYADYIPGNLHQAVNILLPELLVLLEREGRRPLPSQGDIANKLMPDGLRDKREALDRLAGFNTPQLPNLPVQGSIDIPIQAPPPLPGPAIASGGILATLIQLVALLGVGMTCLSMFLALAPVAVIAMALGTVDGVIGKKK